MIMGLPSAHAPHLKRRALDNSQNQGRPPVAVPGGIARDRASDRSIVVFGSSAERVSQKSFRQIADKLTGLFQQNMTQAGRSLKLRPIGEHSRSIDGAAIAIAGYAAETVTKHIRNLVMPREAFIDECVVGIQQIQNAPVLPEHAGEEQFGFLLHGLTQIFIEIRKFRGVGQNRLEIAQVKPLTGKVLHQSVRARIRKQPPNLLFKNGGIFQFALLGCIEERVIGNAAPQEKRQTRSELNVTDAVYRARSDLRRVAFDAEEEAWTDQYSPKRHFDSGLKTSVFAPGLVQIEQRTQIRIRDGPAIGAARERAENVFGARILIPRAATGEYSDAAGCFARTGGVVRTSNRNAADGAGIVAARRWPDGVFNKGYCDDVRTCLCGKLQLQIPVRARVQLRLAAANDEQLQSMTIQANVDLTLFLKPKDRIPLQAAGPLQSNLNQVFPIEREVVMDGEPAARSKRQFITGPIVLHQTFGSVVCLVGGRNLRITNREAADLFRRRQIPLQQER